MNNQFDELTKSLAQSVTRRAALTPRVRGGLGLAGLSLAVIASLAIVASADDSANRNPIRVSMAGQSDWSIVPAALDPPFVFVGTDGNFYLRHLPLVGRITPAGGSVSIEGKLSADFNAELDATFSGPLWAPVILTGTVNGSKTLLFEGNATGNTVGLVSAGVMKLEGHGPFEGARLEIEFTEIGPGNTDTYTLKGMLVQAPRL